MWFRFYINTNIYIYMYKNGIYQFSIIFVLKINVFLHIIRIYWRLLNWNFSRPCYLSLAQCLRSSILLKTHIFCSDHAYFKIYILRVRNAAFQKTIGRRFLSSTVDFKISTKTKTSPERLGKGFQIPMDGLADWWTDGLMDWRMDWLTHWRKAGPIFKRICFMM